MKKNASTTTKEKFYKNPRIKENEK